MDVQLLMSRIFCVQRQKLPPGCWDWMMRKRWFYYFYKNFKLIFLCLLWIHSDPTKIDHKPNIVKLQFKSVILQRRKSWNGFEDHLHATIRPSKSSTLLITENDPWLCYTCRTRNFSTQQCQNCDSFRRTREQINETIPITINMPNGKCLTFAIFHIWLWRVNNTVYWVFYCLPPYTKDPFFFFFYVYTYTKNYYFVL